MELGQQHAVVTGAQGGLGSAICDTLQASSMHVHAAGRNELDVSCPDTIQQFFKAQERIDLLVCNAGATHDKLLAKMSEDDWNKALEVNLNGAFRCAREATKKMVRQKNEDGSPAGGHIIFISSYSALHPPAGQTNYAAAKSALLGLTKAMAQELGSRNVRVNTVIPGWLDTKMTQATSCAAGESALAKHTLGRFNTPDAVAQFIHSLHYHLPHTSGQVFNLDSRIV